MNSTALYPYGKLQMIAEFALRIGLWSFFLHMEEWPAFERKIHQEELWLYKNPRTPSYVPSEMLWFLVVFVPLVVFSICFLVTKDFSDLINALLGYTLSMGINGVITDAIKLTVGRPRPDFFYRCFPDGIQYPNMKCTGDLEIINEGRKSFPSGHSSFSFCSMWFVALHLSAKLRTFSNGSHQQRCGGIRLVATLIPPIVALLIAVSRTCDYHHHWQDISVGSSIGIIVSWLSYRLYFPSVTSTSEAAVSKRIPEKVEWRYRDV
ncbi:phospholipid phosphatase 5-like [Artemia franciscana]|uniref:Phosphatidic acid phosphatase type 2/haloperoxidase domain-containing protein n=2 Tax=Artemia franciscana TaxID=6661 RepID=A0AA88L1F9_ARTSF|nr:hypothetical protein QYM36_010151 [Artemia franciscana]